MNCFMQITHVEKVYPFQEKTYIISRMIKFMVSLYKQGRKRSLDTPKRMIQRREGEEEREREEEIRERDREREM